MSRCDVPPSVFESEQVLLGWILKHPDQMAEFVSVCGDPEYFYYPKHKKIFKAMIDSYRLEEPPDIQIVGPKCGGMADLVELVENTTGSKHQAKIHQRKIIEAYSRRKLITQAEIIIEKAYDMGEPYESIAAEAQRAIMEVSVDQSMQKFKRIGDLFGAVLKEVSDRVSGEIYKRMVRTGICGLDNILHGLFKGDLVTLAGRTSHGKTQLAAQIALNVAKEGRPVGFVSLEMIDVMIVERVLFAEARISSDETWKKDFSSDKFDRLTLCTHKLSGVPMFVDGTGGCSVDAIASRSRQLKAEHGIEFLVVDYLQIVKADARGNRESEVAGIAHGLKAIAMELKIPVLALSQFSRNADNRKENQGRPRLADLRESGAIEQDSSMVIFVHHKKQGGSELIVAKNRHGKTGQCDMNFIDGRWETMSERDK